MRKIRGLLLSGLLVGSTSAALAANYSFAVVDPNRVVEQSPQYDAARKALQQEVADREKKLAVQQKDIDELQKKLERDAGLMSADEVTRLQNDIRNRDRKLKFAQAEFREDIALRQNELRTKLGQQVREVVEEVAKEKNIDLVISEGVVYSSKRIDISDQVVERLKSKFQSK
jgi:outer membrane protein